MNANFKTKKIVNTHCMQNRLLDTIHEISLLHQKIKSDSGFENIKLRAASSNPFFVDQFIEKSIEGILSWLTIENLTKWTNLYPKLSEVNLPKKVGVIMAGNIPLVGFHDLLCGLICGHEVHVKLSSKDDVLSLYFVELLQQSGRFDIKFVERLSDVDAVIATGSDNSFKYFEYYFRNKPSLLRKNRNSVAVLSGLESDDELKALADDIFLYFGLGCRNVSKLYIPQDFELERLFPLFDSYNWLHHHTKYMNNYDYHRAIYLLNATPHLADEKLMIVENKSISSPLSVIHFERYIDIANCEKDLLYNIDKIQCIVGNKLYFSTTLALDFIPFGQSQKPKLTDYADNFDTIKFLLSI